MRISDWSSDVCSSDLGNMGAPMAEYLLKAGYTLSAHDLNEVAVRRLVELGGRAAFSAYDAATEADLVITMLPNDAIVNAIYQGDRKSVVKGKSVSVRVDLGGRRLIKKKT